MHSLEEQKTTVTSLPLVQAKPIPENSDILDVARGGTIALIGATGTKALVYLYNLILIWILGAELFGQFTLALTVVSFIGLISTIGIPQGIIRYGAILYSEKGKAGVYQIVTSSLKIVLPSSLLFMVGILFIANTISVSIFHKPELSVVIQLMAISVPFVGLQSTFLAATRSMREMKYTSIVGVVQPLVALVLAFAFHLAGISLLGAVIAYVISFVIGTVLGLIFYLRMIPVEDRIAQPYPVGPMLQFSVPLSMNEWMHYANERTEIFFLGLLPGSVGISIYKIAWSLAGLETLLRLSLEQILAPYSSDLSHRKEISRLSILYKTTAKWGFTVALMVFLVYVVFGREVMGFFDQTLVSGAGVLIALGAAQLFNEFTGACNTILIMSGRSGLTLINTIILLCTSIGLDWWLIPSYGIVGAAIAGSVSIVFINILRVTEVWLIMHIHPWKLSFLKPILAGAVSAGAIFLFKKFTSFDSIWIDILAALVFCVFFLWLNVLYKLDQDDLLVVQSMKTKIKSFFLAGRKSTL